jgi:Mrp family chromosome partitioning ATPase
MSDKVDRSGRGSRTGPAGGGVPKGHEPRRSAPPAPPLTSHVEVPVEVPGHRTITVVGARGGHGASTVAATLAILAAGHAPTTLVSADTRAMAALLGLPRPDAGELVAVTDTLTLTDAAGPAGEITVIDAGTAADATQGAAGADGPGARPR